MKRSQLSSLAFLLNDPGAGGNAVIETVAADPFVAWYDQPDGDDAAPGAHGCRILNTSVTTTSLRVSTLSPVTSLCRVTSTVSDLVSNIHGAAFSTAVTTEPTLRSTAAATTVLLAVCCCADAARVHHHRAAE